MYLFVIIEDPLNDIHQLASFYSCELKLNSLDKKNLQIQIQIIVSNVC